MRIPFSKRYMNIPLTEWAHLWSVWTPRPGHWVTSMLGGLGRVLEYQGGMTLVEWGDPPVESLASTISLDWLPTPPNMLSLIDDWAYTYALERTPHQGRLTYRVQAATTTALYDSGRWPQLDYALARVVLRIAKGEHHAPVRLPDLEAQGDIQNQGASERRHSVL